MKPVLLDPLSMPLVAAARTLAPEPPAELMDGDLVSRPQLLGARQLERGDDRRHASPQDGPLLPVSDGHLLPGRHDRLLPSLDCRGQHPARDYPRRGCPRTLSFFAGSP